MPVNLPDQNWTVPTGTDLANNPLAFTDFAADVMGTVVLRYPNTATRDAFNGSRIAGDISFTTGSTWYDRWTGSKWIPCTPISAFKTAAQTVNNSTALVNDTALFVTLPAINTNYAIECYIAYNSTIVADIKFDFAFTGTTTQTTFAGPAGATTIAAGGVGDGNWDASPFGTVLQVGGAAGPAGCLLTGGILVSGTAGVLTLRWAQNTLDATNTQVQEGSWLKVSAMS